MHGSARKPQRNRHITSHLPLKLNNKKVPHEVGNITAGLKSGTTALAQGTASDLQFAMGLWATLSICFNLLQSSPWFLLCLSQKSTFITSVCTLLLFVCVHLQECKECLEWNLDVPAWKFWRSFLVSIHTVHCQRKTPVNAFEVWSYGEDISMWSVKMYNKKHS